MKTVLKKTLLISGVLSAMLLMTACQKKEEQVMKEKKGTITLGMPATHVAISNIKHHQKEWEKKTGNKIDVQAVDDNQFDQLALTKITSGGMWDVMFMQTGQESSKYSIEKNFEDLTQEPWVKQLKTEEKKFLELNEKVYYFPNGGINSFGIVYNREVFDKLDIAVPETHEEFKQVASKIKENDITPIYIAMKDPWTVNQILNAEWPNILADNPEMLDKLNKNEMKWSDSEAFINLFSRMSEWVEKGWINEDLTTASYEMAQKALANGEAAMMYMGDWADPEFIKSVPEASGKLGMFAAPSQKGNSQLAVAGPSGYVISKNAKNKALAKEFLDYLSSDEARKYDFETKNSTSVWSDLENENISETLKDSLKYIDQGRSQEHYNKTYVISPSDDSNSAFMSVLLKQETPEEAAKTWSENIIRTGKQLDVEGF